MREMDLNAPRPVPTIASTKLKSSTTIPCFPQTTANGKLPKHEQCTEKTVLMGVSQILLKQDLYDSADILLQYMMATLERPARPGRLKSLILRMLGEVEMAREEYGRAKNYLRQATRGLGSVVEGATKSLHSSNKEGRGNPPLTPPSSQGAEAPAPAPPSQSIAMPRNTIPLPPDDMMQQNRYRFAQAYVKSGEVEAAIAELDKIPSETRNAATWGLLARMYENTMRSVQAKGAFLAVLRLQPFALHAMRRAIHHGATERDLKSALSRISQQFATIMPWLNAWIHGLLCAARHDYAAAIPYAQRMLLFVPTCLEAVHLEAEWRFEQGDAHGFVRFQKQIMRRDIEVVRNAEMYAAVLAGWGKDKELKEFAETMQKRHPDHPASLLCRAHVMHHIEKNPTGAIELVEQTLVKIPSSSRAWLLLSICHGAYDPFRLLCCDPFEQEKFSDDNADVTNSQFEELHKSLACHESLWSYSSLLHSYLVSGRNVEALNLAKNVMARMGGVKGAAGLVGKVLLIAGKNREVGLELLRRGWDEGRGGVAEGLGLVAGLVHGSEFGEAEWREAVSVLKGGCRGCETGWWWYVYAKILLNRPTPIEGNEVADGPSKDEVDEQASEAMEVAINLDPLLKEKCERLWVSSVSSKHAQTPISPDRSRRRRAGTNRGTWNASATSPHADESEYEEEEEDATSQIETMSAGVPEYEYEEGDESFAEQPAGEWDMDMEVEDIEYDDVEEEEIPNFEDDDEAEDDDHQGLRQRYPTGGSVFGSSSPPNGGGSLRHRFLQDDDDQHDDPHAAWLGRSTRWQPTSGQVEIEDLSGDDVDMEGPSDEDVEMEDVEE
ncbi:hypothetical protein DFS34DRAFT_483288 [Phlyctochytrium arcticum]|nr:hypothetical protein DFS34DRAFT_483288 [Phlyctochytrium arcticum]